MGNVAIIPARGGSKRIPRKNIKLFHGKPVIGYAIELAINSELFDEVYVSTDDIEIREISLSYGARVPWLRDEFLSNDHTSTIDVMADAVTRIKQEKGSPDRVCCIYPVTPLLQVKYLERGLRLLEKGKWNFVFSAIRNTKSSDRYFSLDANKALHLQKNGIEHLRTQDLPVTYHDAGQFYWGHETTWCSKLPIFSKTSTVIEIPSTEAVDIDTIQDWEYAEYLFKRNIR